MEAATDRRLTPELRKKPGGRIAQHPDGTLMELKDWLLAQFKFPSALLEIGLRGLKLELYEA